jgi:hypothetical protein
MVAGERGDRKRSRRVREGVPEKGRQGTSPVPYLSGETRVHAAHPQPRRRSPRSAKTSASVPRPWVAERVHSWINRYRRLLIRFSKHDCNHNALLQFCLAVITWQVSVAAKDAQLQ